MQIYMFNKVELLAATFSVIAMATALYLIQDRLEPVNDNVINQTAQAPTAGLIIVDDSTDSKNSSLAGALEEAVDERGDFSRLVIDDIKLGSGRGAENGDTVLVHYAGRLQTGQEFDNSRLRGQPFEFTLGQSAVIQGWEEGIIGMKEGGERILVIPPDKAYGERGFGPIPSDATLVFKIELLDIR